MATKEQLRRDVLTRRRSRPAAERQAAGEAIARWLLPRVQTAQCVAAYVPLPDEPDISALLLVRPDVLLPTVLTDNDLSWTAESDPLGVEGVALCDLVLVPALAVDLRGVRLGRGGGSYDRALRRTTGLTVALLYDDELLAELPCEAHDVCVDAVVTPATGVRLLRH